VILSLSFALSIAKPTFKLKYEDVTVVALPVTYYSPVQYNLGTGINSIVYSKFVQCANSTANNPYISISILQPTNVPFKVTSAFGAMEVSTCPNSFEDDCIIAANYIYSNSMIQSASNTIVIPFNISQSTLYFRLIAVISGIEVALHISYVETAEIFTGQHNSAVFGTAMGGSNWQTFNQLVKTDTIDNVNTTTNNYYYVSFCENAIGNPAQYTVTVTVTSTPSTPLAGFNLAACSVSSIPLNACQVYNKINGVVATESSASTTSVEMDSTDNSYSLSEGIYIDVNGVGGELNGANEYLLSIIETPTN